MTLSFQVGVSVSAFSTVGSSELITFEQRSSVILSLFATASLIRVFIYTYGHSKTKCSTCTTCHMIWLIINMIFLINHIYKNNAIPRCKHPKNKCKRVHTLIKKLKREHLHRIIATNQVQTPACTILI